MRKTYLHIVVVWILLNFSTFASCMSSNLGEIRYQRRDENTETEAVQQLLQRLLPKRVSEFSIRVNYSFYKTDAFQVQAEDRKVLILGNRGYSAALGLQYYLKYYCGAHISWSGMQLQLPSVLPKPKCPKRIVFNDKYRYYMNVCTLSYSTVWWNWTRWEKEIDWMALNGINFPLAFTGQEYFWKEVFLKFNFTEHDIDEFFTGPAFLAWNRMGNIQTWAGPLSDNWLLEKKELLRKILNRMRAFGMIPILPAFSGRVPPSIKRIFPNASITFLGERWSHFNKPYSPVTFLEPTDPLFMKIAGIFLEYYIKEFGTDHFYNVDLFNEMPPPSVDLSYLKSCGEALYQTLISKDPKATWVVQGWMFFADADIWTSERAKAFLTSVPNGRMIVLDLSAELYPQYQRLESFFGQPFIWSTVQSYGGVIGLYGTLENINKRSFEARNYQNSTMVGTGMAPEGIETNDIVYELINEMAWRKLPVQLDKWTIKFAKRRYGKMVSPLRKAVLKLQKSVYNATVPYRNHGKYILIRRPTLHLKPVVWYDPKDVFAAWKLFIISSKKPFFNKSELFRHDLVDVSRQSLQLIMDILYSNFTTAYARKNLTQLENASNSILRLYDDMEELLATDEHFLLEAWINASRSTAYTSLERIQYEYNARNQITLWGPAGEILDYASKQWAGMMSNYYRKRWELMAEYAKNCVMTSRGFNQTKFNVLVLSTVEIPFTLGKFNQSATTQGDAVAVSEKLLRKYIYYL